MTDRERIEWLRERARDYPPAAYPMTAAKYEAIIARLEELTRPAEGSPLTEGRLTQIRRQSLGEYAVYSVDDRDAAISDLLAAYDFERRRADEAEKWCARIAHDREGETALRAAGVAAALATLWRLLGEADAAVKGADNNHVQRMWGDRWNALSSAIGFIEKDCGPAEQLPHERTLADCRRYREALERIATAQASVEFLPVKWAREALEEGS